MITLIEYNHDNNCDRRIFKRAMGKYNFSPKTYEHTYIAYEDHHTIGIVGYIPRKLISGKKRIITFIGVLPKFRRKGYSHLLYDALFSKENCRGSDIVAYIDMDNQASITSHQRYGFESVAVIPSDKEGITPKIVFKYKQH